MLNVKKHLAWHNQPIIFKQTNVRPVADNVCFILNIILFFVTIDLNSYLCLLKLYYAFKTFMLIKGILDKQMEMKYKVFDVFRELMGVRLSAVWGI